MRIKHKVNVTASADSSGKDVLFGLDETLAEVTLDGQQEISSGVTTVAAGDNVDVPLGEIGDARGVMLKADGDFLLSIDGGAQISVRKGAVKAGSGSTVVFASSAKVFLEAEFGSLNVEVAAEKPAITLTYVAWGDPIAGG